MDFLYVAVEGGCVPCRALAGIIYQSLSAQICINLNFYKINCLIWANNLGFYRKT